MESRSRPRFGKNLLAEGRHRAQVAPVQGDDGAAVALFE